MASNVLFTPFKLGVLDMKNRLAVAPMTRVSATESGCVTPKMVDYYRRFAAGGFGLIITEGIYTDQAYAQGYAFQPGLTDPAQTAAWRSVVDAVHAEGSRIFAQLMHAGALSQANRFRRQPAGPSPVRPKGMQMAIYRGSGPYRTPAAMTEEEIVAAIAGFAATAARAVEAGVDGVEIHGANGYLLDEFLTSYTNLRNDRFGGGIERRITLTTQVLRAVRAAVSPEVTVGVRISQAKVNDFEHRWAGGIDDAKAIFAALARAGADYIHTTEFDAWCPAFGEGESLAALAKRYGGLPVFANGSLHIGDRAASLIERGNADVVTLGRAALACPDWPLRRRRGLPAEEFDPAMLQPVADLENSERWRSTYVDRSAPEAGNRHDLSPV
jgi:2,4-dienoyl-CoA reductase-like NADH-dependent reductase (Old Yellow Enzyme family)